VIPEPFFVHSHLTTMIQVADIVAYVIAWGVRVGNMDARPRTELASLAEKVKSMRYTSTREINGCENFVVYSFALIDDLRSREETRREK
jgi:hypothetical protein